MDTINEKVSGQESGVSDADTQNKQVSDEQESGQETFDRDYVEKLRAQAARYRTRRRSWMTLRSRIWRRQATGSRSWKPSSRPRRLRRFVRRLL